MHIFHDWQRIGPVKEAVMREKPLARLIAQYQAKKCIICGEEAEFWLAPARNNARWVFKEQPQNEKPDSEEKK